ncbi:hypothetical protein COB72_00455 [bacterium]|nr:MAG: hypothetical protein COB72_00455 [bacterium]
MKTHTVSNPQTTTTFINTIRKNKLVRLGLILMLGLIAALLITTRQTSGEVDRVILDHYKNIRQRDEYGFLIALAFEQLNGVEKKKLTEELLDEVHQEDLVYRCLPGIHQWSFDRQYRARIFDMDK